MKQRSLPFVPCICLLFCAVWAVGCISVNPEISGTPTPSSSPTPLPEPFAPELTSEPLPTDALGKVIETADHYYHYLSFGDVRIYEYDTGTFMDGICVNAFPQPLDGVLNIVYYTGDGKICGIGQIHNAEGSTVLQTGSNAVYAEISTDISVLDMDFVLEIATPFAPVEAATETE